MHRLLCITILLQTRMKNVKQNLDKNNRRIRLRGGLILYNNDTNKRNDV